VTIPQELRRKYRIDSHAEVDFVEEDGRIVVKVAKKSESSIRKLVGRGDAEKPSKENPPFPGHYKVSISGKPVTVHKKVLDPKEKVRELLKQ